MNMIVPAITGLALYPDYVDEAAAHALITYIDDQIWLTDLKRRVQHYGYRYDYRARAVDPSMYMGALPPLLREIGTRLFQEGIFGRVPDQGIVNEYMPGQGIASHTDCEPCFGDVIASLTLASGCIMRFTALQDGTTHDLYLPTNSLLILQGAARYAWQHGIPPRKSDVVNGQKIPRGRRLSLTLRTVTLGTDLV